MTGALAAATIAAKNALALVRVAARSFARHHPGAPFFVLLADEEQGRFAPEREPFRLLRLADLEVPRAPALVFGHTREELSYALPPRLLAGLLARGFPRALYLKQESLVCGDLSPSLAPLESGASVVLTPHLLAPLDGREAASRELNVLQSGLFNAGFVAVRDSPEARAFLAWWGERTEMECRHDLARGLHYEQRWLDLAPALFEGVHVLRDPGANVGHWNLPERAITVEGDRVLAQGGPCALFRFSGFDPDRPLAATRHSPRLTLDNLGPAATVFRRWLALLEAAGHRETRTWPYAWGRFDNGVPIPELARRIYRELGEAAGRFGDPFATAPPGSFYRWLQEPADGGPGAPVSRLWLAVWERRADVQAAYPDPLGAGREAFLAWTARSGAREHEIPEAFVAFAPRKEAAWPA